MRGLVWGGRVEGLGVGGGRWEGVGGVEVGVVDGGRGRGAEV